MHRRSLATFLLLLAPALLGSACAPLLRSGGGTSQALLRERLPRDSSVVVGTLENGMRYYIRQNNEPQKRVELRLAVDVGSVLEDDDQRGLAHMVEHMAFNGTKHFAKHELVDYLESVGMRFGPDVNAYTSFDETVFMLTLPTDSAGVVDTGLLVLDDWARGITFDSLEVEKERGVVIEEWRLGQGAQARLRERQFPQLLKGSRYAERLPIGTRESLERFDHAALKRFYRDWYRPELMAVVVVGDVDPRAMEQQIRARFGTIPRSESPRRRREYTVPPHRETLYSVATDPELTGSSVSIYKKQPARPGGTAGAYRQWMVESIASGVLGDRLNELTQKPDAPFLDVSSFQGRFLRPTEAFVLSASVKDGGIERGLRGLLTESGRIARHGVTESEVARKRLELMRMMEQRWAEQERTTSAQYAAEYVSHFLYGGEIVGLGTEYALYKRFLDGIRTAEVDAVVRDWLHPENRVVLANAPAKPGVRLPSEQQLAAAVEAARRTRSAAYTEAVGEAPLVAHPPAPSRVVAEREIPEVGITEWTLANGVRVLLKPTDFKDDEILLAGRSPGGSSLVPDRDYVAALTATAVVQAGGLGELNMIELQKRLAGKVVSVGSDIALLHEGVSGVASPRDVETLFELVYLHFTAPRLDSTAIDAYRARARAALENRGASPEVAFQDTLRVTLAQNHPRAQPPSSAIFDRLDIDRSFEIYRDRFGDASDFTFYVVGTFSPDSLRPLVERYLGGLPAAGRVESWRDVGIRAPAGVVEKTVRKGSEPKGRAQIVFSGAFDFDRAHVNTLDALGEVLQLRLREQLREELGGTYGVGVSASASRDPRSEYRVAIGFGADPARLDELTRVVFAEVDSLQRFGPKPEELAKVREMRRRSREVNLRQNQFWIAQLITYDRYGWALGDIAADETPASAMPDRAALQAAARRYLDARNYVRVFLVPES